MATRIRVNQKNSGFTIFTVDDKGKYLKCIEPSAFLKSGKVDLTGCLYDGCETFAAVVKEFSRNMKIKGFTLRGYNVRADDYLLSCNVPMQLIDKTPGFQEYEFVR